MKPITAFGLVSALLLLSVSTYLVVKQNSNEMIAQQDIGCLRLKYDYNQYRYNTCQQPRKFLIVYKDKYSTKRESQSHCLSHDEEEKSSIIDKDITILKFESSDC